MTVFEQMVAEVAVILAVFRGHVVVQEIFVGCIHNIIFVLEIAVEVDVGNMDKRIYKTCRTC